MKKRKTSEADREMLPEYDFKSGVRGKYAERFADGSNVIVLAADVAESFPDSDSVNEALRTLIKIAERTTPRTATK